jgi:chemotaxis protein methyltransferase CheR
MLASPTATAAWRSPPAHPITPDEFEEFRRWIRAVAGIHLTAHKRALVMGRLAGRLRARSLSSYGEYFRLLAADADEHAMAVDLLTTNETHFFREPRHFEFLAQTIVPARRRERTFRAWSAACSTGEEPYSIAMTLADTLGTSPWEVLASDLSGRALARARTGHYAMPRARGIPVPSLHSHCLRGVGGQSETFLVEPSLRQRVQFSRINLNEALPDIGVFDVVFLRNVMIYFDARTKADVVSRVVQRLRPGGYLLVGHSESLNGVTDALRMVKPSMYVKD